MLSPAEVDAEVDILFTNDAGPRARFAVTSYWIRYESRYYDAAPATVTAQLFLPVGAVVDTLYLFAPGTTDLIDACRVSREHIPGIN